MRLSITKKIKQTIDLSCNKALSLMIISFFTCLITVSGQTKSERLLLGKTYAEKELKSALGDKTQHNLIDNKSIIIKDSLTAVNVAEQILFDNYNREQIIAERPYETYFIDKYWIIFGTLPKDYEGGTFLIIIDSRDSKIIRLTHSK